MGFLADFHKYMNEGVTYYVINDHRTPEVLKFRGPYIRTGRWRILPPNIPPHGPIANLDGLILEKLPIMTNLTTGEEEFGEDE